MLTSLGKNTATTVAMDIITTMEHCHGDSSAQSHCHIMTVYAAIQRVLHEYLLWKI